MTHEELKSLFESLRRENVAAREENAAAHVETRRYFDIVVEAALRDVRLVAEGVAQTREEVARLA